MERISLISSTITLYSGIYFIADVLPNAMNYVLIFLIFFVNIFFFLYWLRGLIKEFVRERKEKKGDMKTLGKSLIQKINMNMMKD